jgi:predicted alpha/beta-fold hydrolase
MDAVRFAATLEDGPVYVTGYSLGGNFGLRIARAAKEKPIENLAHVFAISPVVNPSLAAPQGDKHPLIKRYFIKKWGRSLIKKQAAFPDLYDFKDILSRRTIMDMSAALVTQYLPRYKDLTEFFNGYRIWPDDLKDAKTPLTIIMSRDDPVVPAEHLDEINLSDSGTMIMLERGGHNGFFDSVYGQPWYERYILDIMGTL